MLSSITPLGERGRSQRWWLTATAYVLGSALGGAALGALLGLVGTPLASRLDGWALAAAVAVLAGVALVFDAAGSRLRLPRYGRQVNEDWMSMYRGWVYGLGYGTQLGAGLTTIVTAAVVYLVFAMCLLSGSWSAGLVLGLTFGAVRGLALLSARGVDDPDRLMVFHRRLQAGAPVARAATVAADVVVLVTAVAVVA
jgi:MFS family permease